MSEPQHLFPLHILEAMPASPQAFLQRISPGLDDDMLWKIARADYGYQADSCFAALCLIRKNATLPAKPDFALQEVLELTRWYEADSERSHRLRAFACACLIGLKPVINIVDENATLAAFLESALTLEPAYRREACELLAWRILHDYRQELACDPECTDPLTDPFMIFAWLLLLVDIKAPAEAQAAALTWLLAEVPAPHVSGGAGIYESTFLLGSTNFNQRHEVWKRLSAKVLSTCEVARHERLSQALRVVGLSVVQGTFPDQGFWP